MLVWVGGHGFVSLHCIFCIVSGFGLFALLGWSGLLAFAFCCALCRCDGALLFVLLVVLLVL